MPSAFFEPCSMFNKWPSGQISVLSVTSCEPFSFEFVVLYRVVLVQVVGSQSGNFRVDSVKLRLVRKV